MSIIKGTLAKNNDGVVDYIYPKTQAELVEYEDGVSVKDKLDNMDSSAVFVGTTADLTEKYGYKAPAGLVWIATDKKDI